MAKVKVTLKKGYTYRAPAGGDDKDATVYGKLYRWEDGETFEVSEETYNNHQDVMNLATKPKKKKAEEGAEAGGAEGEGGTEGEGSEGATE